MGCLLYEIAVGKRAFYNDYAVLQYCDREGPFLIRLDSFPDENARPMISEAISGMLQELQEQRPTAAELYEEFCRRCRLEFPRNTRSPLPENQDPEVSSPITDG